MVSRFLTSQFSTEAGIGAAAIRYFTMSKISHVDIVIPKSILTYAIVQGWFQPIPKDKFWYDYYPFWLLGARLDGGVQLRPPNYAKFTNTIPLGCEVPDIDAGYQFAFAQIGKPYNKGAIVDFIFHRRRKFSFDQPSWFCDCLEYAVYWKAGVRLLNSDDPLDLTPQEVMLSSDFSSEKMMMKLQPAPRGVLL